MHSLVRDMAFTLRLWRREPRFVVFSVVVLSVGIGASLALFGLFDALALRTLPVDRPDRLVAITTTSPERPDEPEFLPLPVLRVLEQRQRVFSTMAGYISGGVSTLENERPVEHGATFITGGYFETIGVRPVLGRLFAASDVGVVVISDSYWQRRYGRNPDVIGQTIRLEAVPFVIVGVAPRRFTGLQTASPVDFFLPIESVSALFGLLPEDSAPLTRAVGRLQDDMSVAQARSQLQAMWPAVAADTVPPAASGIERDAWLARRLDVVSASRGFSYIRDWYATPLQLLVVSAGGLLLVLCVNLAGLVWARALSRQRELDVRMAIGASPVQVVSQLSIESLLLTTAGTLLALPIAWTASRALVRMMWNGPAVLPVDLTPGWRVYIVTMATAAVIGLTVALLPAWKTYRRARAGWPSTMLSSSSGRVASRANDALVVTQVAVTLILLVGGGLVTASLLALRDRAGFQTAGIHLLRLLPKPGAYAGIDVRSHLRDLVERTAAVPGVTAVALSMPEPLMGIEAGEERQVVTAADIADGIRVLATLVSVSPDYFRTMRVPLTGGREFSWSDDRDGRAVAILSSRSAARLFPNDDATGRAVRIGTHPGLQRAEVVGIAADVRLADLHTDEPLFVFVPLLQRPEASPAVIVRSHQRQATLEPSLRAALESAGRDYVVAQRTLDAQIGVSLLRERLMALGAGWIGGLAALLVVAGVAGVLSQFVTGRTREIGIRVALGASPAMIRHLVLRRTLALTGTGILLGLPIACFGAIALTRQLSAVSAGSPTTFLLAILVVVIVSLAAAWTPMRRAIRISPTEALKTE